MTKYEHHLNTIAALKPRQVIIESVRNKMLATAAVLTAIWNVWLVSIFDNERRNGMENTVSSRRMILFMD